jgi:NAD(P)-dependent dehydrogenase (short-subunit alcohol dehydrogenase family)
MTHPFDLTGKLAVVTGAKRGIGYAMAEALAAAGANIVGVSATIEPEGSAVGVAVAAHGRSFEARAVDFATPTLSSPSALNWRREHPTFSSTTQARSNVLRRSIIRSRAGTACCKST